MIEPTATMQELGACPSDASLHNIGCKFYDFLEAAAISWMEFHEDVGQLIMYTYVNGALLGHGKPLICASMVLQMEGAELSDVQDYFLEMSNPETFFGAAVSCRNGHITSFGEHLQKLAIQEREKLAGKNVKVFPSPQLVQ